MISQQEFEAVAKRLGCSVSAVKAVAEVESRGGGFDVQGFPKVLFEGHWFYRYTKGKYAASNPTLCYPSWTKIYYGKSAEAEKNRLAAAASLDRTSANLSTSWGMFQVMGFNYAICGYKSVQEFVNAMCKSEGAQLEAFCSYVINNGLDVFLRAKDWDSFAYGYNGKEYRKNDYAGKLRRADLKHQ
jgi:hypothetical protein